VPRREGREALGVEADALDESGGGIRPTIRRKSMVAQQYIARKRAVRGAALERWVVCVCMCVGGGDNFRWKMLGMAVWVDWEFGTMC
jgi:hypothetical protein